MNELEPTSPTARKCPVCGADLPANLSPEQCPRCLLRAGLSTQPEVGPGGTLVVPAAPPVSSDALPRPGETFGHYRIVRRLGQGGMGTVFEAEDLETARRVALKVLGQALDSPEARKRFLREGRLAASINHPNSVYVFGTEEIADTPVIAMELVAGGTLQQRVEAHGPLSAPDAVDAILQIIAGLEAAQALGILHRDIKPSNCFEDADGTVKIGDFGLSISTAARAESNATAAGLLLGTPTFSSPEQLRGDELNVRSDLYAVGVTLFYLLTGRTPFAGNNVVQLIANVIEQPVPSPRQFRPTIPAALANVVLRCLEKQPGERWKNYDELRQALAPFSSAAPVPAPLALRLAAGAIDMFSVGIVGVIFWWLVFWDLLLFSSPVAAPSPKWAAMIGAAFSVVLAYYAVLEGRWGATVGKAICRLRVVGPDRNPPGVFKALVRAVIILILPVLPYWVSFGFDPTRFVGQAGLATQYAVSSLYYVILGLLFCTARRRNGFAAVHDLLTGTRVIRRMAYQARPVLAASLEATPATETKPMVGPYHVLESLERTAAGEWLLGYDTRLLRKVWIQTVPAAAAPVPPSLRNLGRVGRLRWIAGHRGSGENWDAFEAATGQPLLALANEPQPWSQVRFWLLDLARELQAAEKDGTLPGDITLERVWITAEGRAKLLDYPAPGLAGVDNGANAGVAPPPLIGAGEPGAAHFLSQVALTALEGRSKARRAHLDTTICSVAEASPSPPAEGGEGEVSSVIVSRCAQGRPSPNTSIVSVPLPLHAREFLSRLSALAGPAAIAAALQPLLQQITHVTRARRAGLVAGCLALPLIAAAGVLFGTAMLARWERQQPGVWDLSQILHVRASLRQPWIPKQNIPNDRLLAIYIAGHHRSIVTNAAVWRSLYALSMIQGASRQFAERSVTEHPQPTEQEILEATAALKPFRTFSVTQITQQRWLPLAAGIGSAFVYVGLPALLAALLFRGGLVMRALRVAVVRRNGAVASRLRVFWRSMITWSPLPVAVILGAILSPVLGLAWASALAAVPLGALMLASLALRERSLQDRLAGTVLVPR